MHTQIQTNSKSDVISAPQGFPQNDEEGLPLGNRENSGVARAFPTASVLSSFFLLFPGTWDHLLSRYFFLNKTSYSGKCFYEDPFAPLCILLFRTRI